MEFLLKVVFSAADLQPTFIHWGVSESSPSSSFIAQGLSAKTLPERPTAALMLTTPQRLVLLFKMRSSP